MNFNLLDVMCCPICGSNKLSLNENILMCHVCNRVNGRFETENQIVFNMDSSFNNTSFFNTDPRLKFVQKNWTRWRQANDQFFSNFKFQGLTVDLGSGPGIHTPRFAGSEIINIDFMKYQNVNIVSDLNQGLPLISGIADSVVLSNFLEHTKYPNKILKESFRILKKDGNLYITVPFLLKVHQEPYDYLRYTHIYLENLLVENNFEIRQIDSLEDFYTFEQLSKHFYGYHISNGSLTAKLIWQFQKMVNFLLFISVRMNKRLDFTGGYMIFAKKIETI